MHRTFGFLIGLLLALHPFTGHAWVEGEDGSITFTAADTLAAINAVDPDLRGYIGSTVRCETGGTFNPYSVGDHGLSIGAAQLHRYGLRSTFYAWGYDDPYNPYEAVDFMQAAFRAGLARHWSCARR